MKISVVGTGYVGLVSGVCLADIGHDVSCFDINKDKISLLEEGECPIYEPGLGVKLAQCLSKGNLSFKSEFDDMISDSDIVLIAVGTPEGSNGEANLSYLYQAVNELTEYLNGGQLVIIKSTVPPGTNKELKNTLGDKVLDVVSNPEFLREGYAIHDFMYPDRIVFGRTKTNVTVDQVLHDLYRPLNVDKSKILFTDHASAELIKYAANAFLATKITFVNELVALSEALGGDINAISLGMGLDARIGEQFLRPGPGYGGSCFPKDTVAIRSVAERYGVTLSLIDSTIRANQNVKESAARKVVSEFLLTDRAKRICLFGCTFKPGTDDMREAPSIEIVRALNELNIEIVICDEQGFQHGHKIFDDVEWIMDPYHAAMDCDLVVLVTEWKRFLSLDYQKLASVMSGSKLLDLKFLLDSHDVTKHGLQYVTL